MTKSTTSKEDAAGRTTASTANPSATTAPEKTADDTEPETANKVDSSDPRLDKAESIVKTNVYITAGVGFLPLPVIDAAAVTAIQLNMLRKVSNLYGVKFSKNLGKNLISSLVGGSYPLLAGGPIFSVVKAVPLVGPLVGGLTFPALSGATTHAIGKVFILHFESGGTLLDFDPREVKAHFEELRDEGKQIVANTPAQPAAT